MVDSQRDLEKLIKMLRKNGVESAKIGQIEIKLGHLDPEPSRYMRKKAAAGGKQANDFPTETPQFTDEQILMWSSTPPGAEPQTDS